MPTDIKQILTKLGLTESEAKVYLSMLKLGEHGVQQIARESKISRTAAYEIVSALQKKGLVSEITRGKKNVFAAEDPEKLEAYFEQRIKDIHTELDTLRRVTPELRVMQGGGDKSRVRFFTGEEGLKALYRDVELVAPRELLEISNIDAVYQFLDAKLLDSARQVINYDRTRVKMLHRGEPRKHSKGVQLRRIGADAGEYQGDIWIYANRIAYINFVTRLEVVIVDNQIFSDTMRALFMTAWNQSKDTILGENGKV
ncbi:MAG: HTH-type transcriptional regulator, sugar sensing transcriptional regulator [Patescibacteria group bacterium]|jgi:sugar-specific transcriptional regulator TrmB|nr:HTH-type transcriptional regulator, sugar sensing transcriptional regulator [Patescibacteria group bacterium]